MRRLKLRDSTVRSSHAGTGQQEGCRCSVRSEIIANGGCANANKPPSLANVDRGSCIGVPGYLSEDGTFPIKLISNRVAYPPSGLGDCSSTSSQPSCRQSSRCPHLSYGICRSRRIARPPAHLELPEHMCFMFPWSWWHDARVGVASHTRTTVEVRTERFGLQLPAQSPHWRIASRP